LNQGVYHILKLVSQIHQLVSRFHQQVSRFHQQVSRFHLTKVYQLLYQYNKVNLIYKFLWVYNIKVNYFKNINLSCINFNHICINLICINLIRVNLISINLKFIIDFYLISFEYFYYPTIVFFNLIRNKNLYVIYLGTLKMVLYIFLQHFNQRY